MNKEQDKSFNGWTISPHSKPCTVSIDSHIYIGQHNYMTHVKQL